MTHVLQNGNQIGDRGAEMICEGLKVNRSLRHLRLVRLVFLSCVLIAAGVLIERVIMFRRVLAMGMHVFVQFLY